MNLIYIDTSYGLASPMTVHEARRTVCWLNKYLESPTLTYTRRLSASVIRNEINSQLDVLAHKKAPVLLISPEKDTPPAPMQPRTYDRIKQFSGTIRIAPKHSVQWSRQTIANLYKQVQNKVNQAISGADIHIAAKKLEQERKQRYHQLMQILQRYRR